jgi:hypothetical protein
MMCVASFSNTDVPDALLPFEQEGEDMALMYEKLVMKQLEHDGDMPFYSEDMDIGGGSGKVGTGISDGIGVYVGCIICRCGVKMRMCDFCIYIKRIIRRTVCSKAHHTITSVQMCLALLKYTNINAHMYTCLLTNVKLHTMYSFFQMKMFEKKIYLI